MNVSLLRLVQEHILAHPDEFQMNVFCLECNVFEPLCKTVGCIAGWTVMLNPDKTFVMPEDVFFNWSAEAGQALGIDKAQYGLFHVGYWPERFLFRYRDCLRNAILIGEREFSKLASDVIDAFIADPGSFREYE